MKDRIIVMLVRRLQTQADNDAFLPGRTLGEHADALERQARALCTWTA